MEADVDAAVAFHVFVAALYDGRTEVAAVQADAISAGATVDSRAMVFVAMTSYEPAAVQ